MSKSKNKAFWKRILRKKFNRGLLDGCGKMIGRYCRYNYGGGV